MLFSSALFVFLFLPVVLGANFALDARLRNLWLLAASLVFYAWGEGAFVVVMLGSIAVNWAFGLWIGKARERAGDARPPVLPVTLAVACNLAPLLFFKYADWLWRSAQEALAALGLGSDAPSALLHALGIDPATSAIADRGGGIHLPIGISFFTFQAISYVVDVHRGQARAQRNPLHVALYVSLFPQLVAGPIVRYRDVAAQILRRHVDLEGFADGVRRFVVGLAKKLLVANVLGEVADRAFAADPDALPGPTAWLGIACYGLQIYFDFSGYSDMAIGLGRMLGFRFLENFAHPYVARSITEFWRRWHVSLSTFFRDYVYVPLGGNRRGRAVTARNLLIVFVLCGLWHGAQWTFLLWGLWHGAFLVLERTRFGSALAAAPRPLRHGYVLLAVMLGWVLFRAENLSHALQYFRALAFLAPHAALPLRHPALAWLDPPVVLALLSGIIGSMPWLPLLRARLDREDSGLSTFVLARAAGTFALFFLLLLCAMRLAAGTYDPFIYFRF